MTHFSGRKHGIDADAVLMKELHKAMSALKIYKESAGGDGLEAELLE